MLFGPVLGHGICATIRIPCDCAECKYILDKPWIHGLAPQKKLRYQTVTYLSYWPVI